MYMSETISAGLALIHIHYNVEIDIEELTNRRF